MRPFLAIFFTHAVTACGDDAPVFFVATPDVGDVGGGGIVETDAGEDVAPGCCVLTGNPRRWALLFVTRTRRWRG